MIGANADSLLFRSTSRSLRSSCHDGSAIPSKGKVGDEVYQKDGLYIWKAYIRSLKLLIGKLLTHSDAIPAFLCLAHLPSSPLSFSSLPVTNDHGSRTSQSKSSSLKSCCCSSDALTSPRLSSLATAGLFTVVSTQLLCLY